MAELILQFEQLNESGKQDLLAYLRELLAKKEKRKKPFDMDAYRKNLLSISVWQEEDLAAIEETRRHFNEWKPREW